MDKSALYNDMQVNNGFPEGMTLADLKPMALVRIRWMEGDESEDSDCIVTELLRPYSTLYVGPVDFTVFDPASGVHGYVDQTQIVKLIFPSDNIKRLLVELGKYPDRRSALTA